MTSLRRFTQSIVPFLVLGSCAELIGLTDYDRGDVEEGGAGEATTGGRAGTMGLGGTGATVDGGKPGMGGEEDGGNTSGGTAPTGGRPVRPTGGEGGMGGEPDGGTGGKGGTTPTGGTAPTGGAGMSATGGVGGRGGVGGGGAGSGGGGTGGSPACTEITVTTYVGGLVDDVTLPALSLFDFDFEPQLGAANVDTFEIQFWDSQGMGSFDGGLTGTFDLATGSDANYAFCSRCLVAFEDQATTRERMYFQTEGTLTIAANSRHMEGLPNWTLTDVTLREVTVDVNQYSTVVPGGACLHITTHTFSLADWTCVPEYYTDTDCDCGCGVLDPTCPNANATACDYCWCNGSFSCTTNEVEASRNWVCN